MDKKKNRHVRMICTVGVSLIKPFKTPLNPDFVPETLVNSTDEELYAKMLNLKTDGPARIKAQDLFINTSNYSFPLTLEQFHFPCAEIQTLLIWLGDNYKDIDELRLIFFPSKDKEYNSRITAHYTYMYLTSLQKKLFPHIKLAGNRVDNIIPLDINVDRKIDFIPSVSVLFKAFDKQLQDAEKMGEEVIFCTSGGFKSISGFAMMYAQIHSIASLYSFDAPGVKKESYEVMSLPMGYAYASMDEEINYLKAIDRDKTLREDNNLKLLPQWVQDSAPLACALIESYNDARKKPYGTGEGLFELLRNCPGDGPAWAGYLEALLVQKWAHLWIGDQISETVEHSRRHSKRLMEFAANLFRCLAPRQLINLGFADNEGNGKAEMYALLIAAIYLHDIGHTALSYPTLLGKDMQEQEKRKKEAEADGTFPLGLFPSAVREVHQLLTSELLKSAPQRYYHLEKQPQGVTESKAQTFEKILSEFVPLVAEHHRGYTTLTRDTAVAKPAVDIVGRLLLGDKEFEQTLLPLEKRCVRAFKKLAGTTSITPGGLIRLTALMRVIDGCDVQADRVISQEYLDARNQRNADETNFLLTQLEGYLDALPEGLRTQMTELKEGRFSGKHSDIYVNVFKALAHLRRRCTWDTWRRVQQETPHEFMALSLANRCAFKAEQHQHFEKHKSVDFVLPVKAPDSGDTVIVKLYASGVESYKSACNCAQDIVDEKGHKNGEYDKVADVLGETLKFKTQVIPYTQTKDETTQKRS